MKLALAGRKSPLRATASTAGSRYAPQRGYDEGAGFLALGCTLVAALVIVLCACWMRS